MGSLADSQAESLRTKLRKDLLNLLEGVRGKKNLVIDKALTGPINLFINFSTLKEHGVDKLYVLENDNTDTSQKNIIYLIRGEQPARIQETAAQVKRLQKSAANELDISICWVPRRTLVSNKILEDEGILGDVNILEFAIDFLPLEDDILSLELNDAFHALYMRKDPTPIFLSAQALMKIQEQHGSFPAILGKGENARKLANHLVRGRREREVEAGFGYGGSHNGALPSATLDSLIILDRDVDFATILLTQLTYEGLVEETVGILHNQAEVDSSMVTMNQQNSSQPGSMGSATKLPSTPNARQNLKSKIKLDSSDALYDQLRTTNFAMVGSILNKVARRLESDYEGRHTARTTSELGDFVKKLPGFQQEHQSLRIHTNLAEELMKATRSEIFTRVLEVQQNLAAGTDPTPQHEVIEELISRDVGIQTVLRLLCLESCMFGGIRSRDLESLKRQILHAYGYQHMLTLDALEKMELLQSRASSSALLLPIPGTSSTGQSAQAGADAGTKTNYAYLRKTLKLIVDEVDEQNPNDIAYVYSGYAPLSVRIVQCILQKSYIQSLNRSPFPLTPTSSGWQGFEDVLKSAKGPTFHITQKAVDEKILRARDSLKGTGGWRTTYIMFLGGITFTEIAALKFVGKQLEEQKKKLVICTTGIISGNKAVDGCMEKKRFDGH